LTIWFLAFLALVWIAVVMPGARRARSRTPLPASKSFKQAMRTIAPPKSARRAAPNRGRWIVAPPTREGIERRRRERSLRLRRKVLAAFICVAGASAIPAVVAGGVWTEAHLFLDGALLAYVALLIELRRRAAEREIKVRHLPAYPEVGSAPLRAVGDRSS
jgi:hypothetical protein